MRPVLACAVAAAVLASFATPARADAPPLARSLGTALAARSLGGARTAAVAVDLRTGKTVFSVNPGLPLVPASNEKLAVTLAALRLLGPGYHLRTEVKGAGRLVGGTWTGSLFLRGGGDPALTSADLDDLAAQVESWGVRRIAGSVLGDDTAYDATRHAPGWKPGFLGLETPPIGALVADRAAGWPRVSAALAAAHALREALVRRGVRVAGPARLGRTPETAFPLALDLSPTLAELVRTMNRESDNFTAEMLLRHLGAVFGPRGTTAAGARAARAALAEAGVPLAGVRLVDGSGLSARNRLTAAALVAILRAGADDPSLRDAFLSSLAVAGVDGTLKERLRTRPARSRVIAKTGTTDAASTLSGFVRGRYAFSVLHNGSPVPTASARAAQDRFATVLAGAR